MCLKTQNKSAQFVIKSQTEKSLYINARKLQEDTNMPK